MRIASAQYEAIMNRSLALNQAHIAELNQQLSSGDRITVPSGTRSPELPPPSPPAPKSPFPAPKVDSTG